MRRLYVALATTLIGVVAYAQYWKAVGRGTIGPTEVQTLYGDSVSDRLLAGGTFLHILNETDTVLAFGQAAWNGLRWDSLATRIQAYGGGEGAQQTYWFLRFQGQLFACGGFGFFDSLGQVNRGMARLNPVSHVWEPLQCVNPNFGGMETLVPKEPQNTLYATGYMGSICGFPESCVFRYDGSAFHVWEPFNQIPQGLNDAYVGTIFDFQGKTYMTCSLPDPVDGSGFVSFLRWNGTAWEHVPGWNTLSPIKEILIHNDTLYVAGTFSIADGGPGNLVAAFSNDQWSDMGGGLFYTPAPMSGAALDLEWFHGDLWACGLFNLAGGIPAHSIAHWDGHRWCVPPGDFRWIFNSQSKLLDMAVWRDSLYVCGGILTVDWDTMKQVVQWIGGDAVDDCSTVGIGETTQPVPDGHLLITPLPGEDSWTVRFPHPGTWKLEVYDATGRFVKHIHTEGQAIEFNLASAAPGIYIVHTKDVHGSAWVRKIRNP